MVLVSEFCGKKLTRGSSPSARVWWKTVGPAGGGGGAFQCRTALRGWHGRGSGCRGGAAGAGLQGWHGRGGGSRGGTSTLGCVGIFGQHMRRGFRNPSEAAEGLKTAGEPWSHGSSGITAEPGRVAWMRVRNITDDVSRSISECTLETERCKVILRTSVSQLHFEEKKTMTTSKGIPQKKFKY